MDEKLRASLDTPEENATTPSKGLKGAKLKAQNIKKNSQNK
mgnify:CR=1 FL=1|jgi:hypothetical protein